MIDVTVQEAAVITVVVADEASAGFSALSAKGSETEAALSAAQAEADRVQTGLDRVATNADAVATAADRVQTGLDRVATGQDAVATAADRVQTGLDRVATNADAVATAADRVQTGLDLAATDADSIATAADRVQTGLDRVATGQDAIATAADRVQTGLDRVATGQDAIATAADRVQTGLDAAATDADSIATAADRVQTGLDRVATGEDRVAVAGHWEDFQARYYGSNAGPPLTDPNGGAPTVGDLFFDTTDNAMKVYDGANWIQASSVVEGVFEITEFTNVATQTVFTVPYDVGLINVYYNGVLLRPTDYTAANGTSVTLATAVTSATDVVTFQAWGAVTESSSTSLLGTAAKANVGVSGNAVPLLNTSVTFGDDLFVEKEGGTEVDLGVRGYNVGPVMHGYRAGGVGTLPPGEATVSFWVKASANLNMSFECEQIFGTGGSTTVDGIGAVKIPVTTSWTKVTHTFTVPSLAGKTISRSTSKLNINLWFSGGPSYNARNDSLGLQSGTFDIAQVQLEVGPIATEFEHRAIGQELALCQRYYQRWNITEANAFLVGQAYSTTAALFSLHPVVPSRWF
jgi:hypothetical protein